MLRSCGVNVDALPLLDVRQEGATDIIGDRALGSDPMQVAALGRAVLDGLASAGSSGSSSTCPATAAHWSTATRSCRSSRRTPKSST